MIFGAHVSIAGGYEKALERAAAIGANCVQMFSGNPRSFAGPPVLGNGAVAEYKKRAERLGITPVYFHAPYLVNLASEEMTGDLSEKLLIAELSVASRLGVRGSIVHPGSFKQSEGAERERQYKMLVRRIKTILASVKGEAVFIIENAGTRKIGRTVEEIGNILSDVNSQRLKVCLDTCHLHAAGYDLRGKEKLDAFLKEFDRKIGLTRLECFHVNDSRDPFGSLRDRHENIGEGAVGEEVFKLLLNHPKLRHFPFIIETPGFDNRGPDKKNLDILKSMVE
jgi:deoxyribonuclease-4